MKFNGVWIVVLGLLLAGCSATGQSPQALPTVVLGSGNPAPAAATATPQAASGGEVVASGVVAPAHQVQVASAQGGKVEAILVEAGEQVRAGQPLARLAGSEKLAAAVEAARTELLAAQQNLEQLEENAGQTRAAAQKRLADANKALDEATKIRGYRQYRNGSDAMINTAKADLILAKDALEDAQNIYNGVSGLNEDNLNRAGALSALSAAQKAYDRAVANLNYLQAMPNPIDVEVAEANLQAAKAEAEAAQREFDRVKDGPDPDALALAEQRVKNAQAQMAAGEAALRDVELTAPFDATVATLTADAGAWVTPGQPLMVLVDLAHLQVKTTDLSERDVPEVQVGQAARVYVKALAAELEGQVSEISPLADTLGGDVVYTATIELLTAAPAGLRPGMSADVTFAPAP